MDESPPTAPLEVPLFPLPGVVLFPRIVLPLHLFEPRYRQMAADALAGAGYIALAHLKPGFCTLYYTLQAPIHPVVCLAQIRGSEKLADGNYNLLVQGVMRALVLGESADHVYRMARVEHMFPIELSRSVSTAARARLEAALLASCVSDEGQRRQWAELARRECSLEVITDVLANELPFSPLEQQVLLDEPDCLRRVELLISALDVLDAIRNARQRVGNSSSFEHN